MWLTPDHFNRGLLLIRCDAHIEPTHTLSHKVTITSSDFIESSRMEHAQAGRGGAGGGHLWTSKLQLVMAMVTLTKLLGT
ncbi:uncharacterized protein LOC143018786 [Oratosquilla oratoria]|uniref:uncharacterized protein LOC143018786 n=1 Tax=Oratosquilla oratoria TaxID=337810 RepID=UPI003F777CF3